MAKENLCLISYGLTSNTDTEGYLQFPMIVTHLQIQLPVWYKHTDRLMGLNLFLTFFNKKAFLGGNI